MTLLKDPEGTEILFLHQVADFTGRHVLEIGCGEGRLTWRVARLAGRLTGIDPLVEAVRIALRDTPDDLRDTISLSGGSSTAMPFASASFDIALLSWSF